MQNIFWKIRLAVHTAKYFTFSKIVNLICVVFSYLLSVFKINSQFKSKPFFLSIEVANFCNLHCPECPVGVRKISKNDTKVVDEHLFKKIIDELKPTLQHLILYFQGEPLLNKHLPDLITYAHDAKIFTSTSTNGQLLNKDNARLLVKSGLDKLIISIDGTSQETYEKYRIGGSLEKAVDGVRNIVFWKKELNSLTPMVEIQFLVLKTNEHQMPDMRILAKTLNADRISFKTAQLYDFENGNPLMTSINRYSRYKKGKDGRYKIKANQPNRCFRLWSGGVVNAHGEVLPCCFDKESTFSFGNVSESSFSSCRKNENAFGFRESILRNRKQHEICRNCTG